MAKKRTKKKAKPRVTAHTTWVSFRLPNELLARLDAHVDRIKSGSEFPLYVTRTREVAVLLKQALDRREADAQDADVRVREKLKKMVEEAKRKERKAAEPSPPHKKAPTKGPPKEKPNGARSVTRKCLACGSTKGMRIIGEIGGKSAEVCVECGVPRA